MNKIPIEKLAPYLPYGLKMIFEKSGRIITLAGLKQDDDGMSFNNKGDALRQELHSSIWNFKPILRPLSNLTELGVDFATEHSINLLIGKDGNYGNTTVSVYKGKLTIEIENEEDYPKTERVDFSTIQTIYDELLKSHYDIFGLIENGLAVDINSLTKSAA